MNVIILFVILAFGIGLQIAVLVYLYKCGENFKARDNTNLQKASHYLHWAKFTAIMDIVIISLLILALFFTGPGAIKMVAMAGTAITGLSLVACGALASVVANYIKKSGTNSHPAWLDAFVASALTWGTLLLVLLCLLLSLYIKKREKIKKEKRDIDTIYELKELGASNFNVNVSQ